MHFLYGGFLLSCFLYLLGCLYNDPGAILFVLLSLLLTIPLIFLRSVL